jgi:hypothetical protein
MCNSGLRFENEERICEEISVSEVSDSEQYYYYYYYLYLYVGISLCVILL